MSKRYRTREEIVAAVLSVLRRQPLNRTRLMFKAKLNHRLLRRYLDHLQRSGLIRAVADRYTITAKGTRYLRTYAEYATLKSNVLRYRDDVDEKRAQLKEMVA